VAESVLITGGAGFIGSHLADELVAAGYRVRALDNLVDQVHEGGARPDYLNADVELIPGDVRNLDVMRGALDGIDAVVHLAARVGVGQSMYEPAEYASVNSLGTAVLLEALLERPVRKLVVASSMSIYGEGAHEPVAAVERSREQLERGEWEPRGAGGEELEPVPTPETKEPSLASVYALTKYDQERMTLLYGAAYDVPAIALRFFNVYGPRQALSNPYTGVIEACFAASAEAVLLHAENLPPSFFDLSSGRAGAMLQKLRNYGIRCAVVWHPDSAQPTSRFLEMADEERKGRFFGLFLTRDAALEWLRRS
jgi:dTDP-L-rhamnose 4-epimerase